MGCWMDLGVPLPQECRRRNAVQPAACGIPKTSGPSLSTFIIMGKGKGASWPPALSCPPPPSHTHPVASQRPGVVQTPPDTRFARRSLPLSCSRSAAAPRRLLTAAADCGGGPGQVLPVASQCQSTGARRTMAFLGCCRSGSGRLGIIMSGCARMRAPLR